MTKKTDVTVPHTDVTPQTLPPTQGLRWFGQAIRGSWGDIDGRSIQGCMDTYADWMDTQPSELPATEVMQKAHDSFGICLSLNDWCEGPFATWSDLLYRDAVCLVCGKTGDY